MKNRLLCLLLAVLMTVGLTGLVYAEDPRPSYQSDGREYGMSFAGLEIKFRVDGKTLIVTDVT